MKYGRKLLSFLVSAAMLASVAVMPAMAADGDVASVTDAQGEVTYYESVQAAVDYVESLASPTEGMDNYTIQLLEDSSETVNINQQPAKNVTVKGSDDVVFTGNFVVTGKRDDHSNYDDAGLTFDGIHFKTDKETLDFIADERASYVCNLTVKNCTATGSVDASSSSVVFVRLNQYDNFTMEGCKGDTLHSLVQLTSASRLCENPETRGTNRIIGCELVNGKNGMNLGMQTNMTIEDTTIDAMGYALRWDASSANEPVTVTVDGCDLRSLGVGTPTVAIRGTAAAKNILTITNSAVVSTSEAEVGRDDALTDNSNLAIRLDGNYWGGSAPRIDDVADVAEMDTYYADEDMTELKPVGDMTVQELIDTAKEGDTVIVPAEEYAEAINVNKAITLKGEDGAVFTNMITVSANGAALDNIDLHYEGAEPVYGNIIISGSDVKVSNCDFYAEYEDVGGVGGRFGMLRAEATATNLTIDGCTFQTNTMGIFPGMPSGAITNSVFKPLDEDDTRKSLAINSGAQMGTVTISGNEFYGNRLWLNGENIVATVTENQFYHFTGTVVGGNTVEIDLSGNYWGSATPDFDTLLGDNVVVNEYYQMVDENGNLTHPVGGPSADQGAVAKKVTFEQDGSKVKVFLEGENGEEIKNLVLANLQFTLEGEDGLVITGFEAADANWTYDSYANGQYVIRQKGEADGAADLSGVKIELGTLTIGGYGAGTLKAQAGQAVGDYTTGIAQRSEDDNNLLDVTETVGCDALDLTVAKDAANLTINLLFNHNLKAGNTAADNDITVTVLDMDGEAAETFAIGADGAAYTAAGAELTAVINKDEKYTVVVEGAGYRTFRQDVLMDADKTMVIWNNYKDNAEEVVDGQTFNATFLAGDIVMDYTINKYDLSAAVSYFGQVKGEENSKYNVKYDLNRDGVIDSYDVAMVLVSWGK